jgi:polysaccharide export outer membrane protein
MGVRVKDIANRFRTRRSLAAVAGLLFVAAVHAQTQLPVQPQLPMPVPGQIPGQMPTQTPTADQLRMLQQLPESQRQELMRALGITELDMQRQTTQDLQLQQAAPIQAPAAEEPEGPPVLEAGSTVIVKLRLPRMPDPAADATRRARSQAVQPPPDLSPAIDDEQRELQELARLESNGMVDPAIEQLFQQRVQRNAQLGLLLGASTYVLDREGRVRFPGVATIPLAGLTETQAARRLEAESSLRPLVADVLLLPLEQFGVDALEPFGYDLFQDLALTFFPATDVPVPPEYTIGPGDQVRIQLFGKQNAFHDLVVTREGQIYFPEIGPLVVAGLSFEEARDLVQERVSQQMIGVTASVTMGELRSIRVFVLGDVERPGSYVVTGLSTITNALFVSGGAAESGSLRRVQLRRGGRTVQTLDVYDMLLHGDSSRDARLQSNDVLFVPPRGPTVAIAGEVQRPAIYELAGERTLEQVIQLAGGLTPTAYSSTARVERVDLTGGRAVRTIDLNGPAGREAGVQNGDRVTIDPLPEDVLTDHVTLAGHVQRPGPYEWRPGMRVSDLIPSVNHLKADADRKYILIRRQSDLTGPIRVFSADLGAALSNPGGPDDALLQNLDEATVFNLGRGRVAVIGPVLRQLRQQAVFGEPAREVEIGGMVHAPGVYPLEEDMRVSDLIRAGGNLTDSAYGLTADVARYQVESGSRRIVDMKEVDLAAVLAGDPAADVLLEPFDQLNIRQVSEWRSKGSVTLQGEVRFPGRYPIEAGETLSSVIARAGGMTDLAYSEGSVFLREDLKEREREQIDRLITRLESDIAIMMLQTGRAAAIQGVRGPEQSLAVGQSILGQLRRAEPLGRLVIDVPALLAGNKDVDVILRDGDRLLVPPLKQEVMVLGEVQYATSHLIQPGLKRDDYVAASGGLTVNGDDNRIYVVRANGAVVGSDGSKWFRRGAGIEMRPGDAVVVPLDVDRVPALALWQASTSILYNLAVAVAAIGSL